MRLHLRADASVALGLGHVLRSVALAENARERDIDVRFVVGGADFGRRAVIARGFAARPPTHGDIDWSADLDPGDLVVIDGPHLTHNVGPAHDRHARVAVIDDADGSHPSADVVVCADRAVSSTTGRRPSVASSAPTMPWCGPSSATSGDRRRPSPERS